MPQTLKPKQYDLEDRTLKYAQNVRDYVRELPKTISNIEYSKQGIRASGSVAANYIEANESLSKKDFVFRVKISKKEAKESKLWLLLSEPINDRESQKQSLINEADELMKIFGAIVEKSSN